MERREFLRLSSAAVLSCSVFPLAAGGAGTFAEALRRAPSRIVPMEPRSGPLEVALARR